MTKYRPGGSGIAQTRSRDIPDNRPASTNQKRRKKWPIVLILVIDGILLLALVFALIVNYYTKGMKHTTINTDDLGIVEVETRVDEEGRVIENHVVNIAFFGVDTRDSSASFGDQNRSDSIMVISVDPDNNAVKMTSILRDSKVPIEGHDPQKINAAYKYGGPTLAIKTLNQNYKLDIASYVTVDFGELASVVDIIGGVDVELTADEAALVNDYAAGVMHYDGRDAVEGWNTLNGAQAVSFSRIRKIDSDYYRAGRQQIVLTAIFNKVKDTPTSQYPTLIKQLLECVETSLSYTEILTLAMSVNLSSAKLVRNTIPDAEFDDPLWGGIDDTGSWVWVYDLDAAADRIHKIIYD